MNNTLNMFEAHEQSIATHSRLNTDRLSGQNKRLYDYLIAGNKINCFDHAIKILRIGYLNSRISDLVKAGVSIEKKRIRVKDTNGELVSVKEYWVNKEN